MKLNADITFYDIPNVEMVKFLKIGFQDIVQFHLSEDVETILKDEHDLIEQINNDLNDFLLDASAAFKQVSLIQIEVCLANRLQAVMVNPGNTFTKKVLQIMDTMM